jgi:hypothetical protein
MILLVLVMMFENILFAVNGQIYFANLNVRQWWVSLIKSILKAMNYKLTPHKISTKMEDNTYKCLIIQ